MHATQVFTPDSLPTLTFVNRNDVNYEDELRAVSRASKVLVSLFGPSKSGKTVLLERVIGEANLIKVSGATIEKAEDVWRGVLSKLGGAATRHEALTETSRRESGQKIGLEGGVPLIATAKGEASFGQSRQSSLQRKEGGETNLMYEVEKKIAGTHQFVLIDDFHYIASREVQVRLAQQIKDMFERGVKIAVAQVLHKRDDILRSNPELRGDFGRLSSSTGITMIWYASASLDFLICG